MENSRSYFGTDGIRGQANIPPLDPESLVRLGKAVATVFLRRAGKHRILIGKDTRLSGYMIETSISAGITCMGADVLLVGPLPTPGVAYLTKSMRADAGIVISASHNPFEDNGIKIFGADGFKLPDHIEREIENLMQPGVLDNKVAQPSDIGKATRISDAVGRYTVALKNCFPRECTLEGMKIGLDCANGAAYVVGPQTLTELGAEVVARGISPNGRNINAGFGSLYPEIVRKLVLDSHLDFGICLDGDADRCILVDEKGGIVDGDAILAMVAIDSKARGALKGNAVVSTVMANLGLDKILSANGIKLERAAVGDRYVLEKLTQGNLNIGGEQSGHTIFLDHSTTGDGLLTALMVLGIMGRTGKKLSALAAVYEAFPQKLVNVVVREKINFEKVPVVKALIEKVEKELNGCGRLLVRYSGTENKARVMVECESKERCERLAGEVAGAIEREIG